MKKILIVAVLSMMICAGAQAATLHWDHSTGTVNGYRVYQDDMAAPVGELAPDVNSWALPADLVIGQEYLLGVSAFNQAGESAKAMVRFTYQTDIEVHLSGPPTGLHITWD